MVEQVFKFSTGNEKAVEKLIMDENVHYIHMVFNKEEGLPEHYSNSNNQDQLEKCYSNYRIVEEREKT